MTIETTASHEKTPPTYEQTVDTIAKRFTTREVAPGHEHDFEELLAKNDELETTWRDEGFEGAMTFLTPSSESITVGRKIQPEELAWFQESWQEGKYPKRAYLDRPDLREQTFRVMIGDETRDVTIPVDYQWKPLRFSSSDRVETPIYDIAERDDLSEDMEWLRGNLGDKVTVGFALDYNGRSHFDKLSIHDSEIPSLEVVANRIKATRDAANIEALDIESAAHRDADALKKGLFESKSKYAARKRKYVSDRLNQKS